MSTLPAAARRSSAGCIRSLRRRGCRCSSSPARCRSCSCSPGSVDFLGRMYAFGAMLSFTIAHASVIALRVKTAGRRASVARAAEPPDPRRQLAALRGRRRPRHRHRVARRRRPGRADALRGPRAGSRSASSSTRSTGGTLHAPLAATVRAPIVLGPGGRARVPQHPRAARAGPRDGGGARRRLPARDRAARARRRDRRRRGAARPAARRGDAGGRAARRTSCSTRARTLGDSYGVDVHRQARARPARRPRDRRARPSSGTARSSSWARRGAGRRAAPVFGDTTDYVLKHAPCRVMVVGARAAA